MADDLCKCYAQRVFAFRTTFVEGYIHLILLIIIKETRRKNLTVPRYICNPISFIRGIIIKDTEPRILSVLLQYTRWFKYDRD